MKKLSVAATAPPVPGLVRAARESSKKLKKAGEEAGSGTGTGRAREETSDNISKEKQLFFRQSAFNAEKKKAGGRAGQSGGDTWGFAAAAAGGQASVPGPLALQGEEDRAAGMGQLKGLFDGLSHLFAAPTQSRVRAVSSPSTSTSPPARKKEVSPARPPPAPTPKATAKRTARIGLTPSRLVKTAASKQLEQERRRLLDESPACQSATAADHRGLARGNSPKHRLIASRFHEAPWAVPGTARWVH